ncbi:MAG: gamma-glutamyltransferase [Acidimicrobiia bacterium]|nr:MAG: gamma-glutamyltransferase [Acidimicrobiia bacterium]
MAGWTSEARAYPSGVVATPHYLATAAGLAVLDRGGNAMDAAIAANLVLGVVTPYLCGFGGDVLAIVWDGGLHGYLGVGRSPAAATVDGVRERTGAEEMPVFGPHTVTVPGAPRGWFDLLERFGTRTFGDLATPALRYATEGFPLTRRGARYFSGTRALYDHFGLPDFGRAHPRTGPGDVVRQPGLARTIRTLAEEGPAAYYEGPIADAIVERLGRDGSFMTAGDLAAHAGEWVTPLRAGFHGVEVAELPPPTQGVTALAALRVAEALDLPADGAARTHLLVEATKRALVDRNRFVGDPAAMTVAAEDLYAHERVAALAAAIDPDRAWRPPPDPGPDGGTAYLCAADRDGLLVSLIQTNFTAAGSGVRVEPWGINLHNRGSSFRFRPGHPNALGGAKLPMHTLIPALALRGGRPWLVFGAMGGHTQAQTHLQLLVRTVVDGDDPQAAISAPRWALDPDHWHLGVESRFPEAWRADLAARGHELRVVRAYDDGMGHAHAVEVAAAGYRVATDPRAEGAAAGI